MMSAEEAAKRLNSTARIVRYRERLGLLRPGRVPRLHRRFTQEDLAALRLADSIERSYGASPGELAFALRALTSSVLASKIETLAQITGRLVATSAVLNFEQQKALALLANSTRTAPQRGAARDADR